MRKLLLFVILVTTAQAAVIKEKKKKDSCPLQNLPYTSPRTKVSKIYKDHPLVGATTQEIIMYYNYPVESHHITTDDGYYLEIHRIPFGKDGQTPGEIRKPVLVQHGLLCSSFDWVVNGPEQALAFQLSDAGYDVWLGNIRGNTYSKGHIEHHPWSSEYWDFTWDEMGEYDLPAVIDYIIFRTGFDKIHYIGHSMGTTMFFVMMDKHPEYNDKVEELFGLGAVATTDSMISPLRIFAPLAEELAWLMSLFGFDQFLPSTALMTWLAETFCEDDDFTQMICSNVIFIICGYNPKQLNDTMLPVYISGTPAGTSTKNVVHYTQGVTSAKFQDYDYTKDWINENHYGQSYPPEYDLGKTTAPAYLYWGANDWLATPEDTMELAEELGNLKLLHRVEDDKWAHLDFMWGINATEYVYDYVIKEMKRIDEENKIISNKIN